MDKLERFEVLDDSTLENVVGGKGLGWIGLLQPVYDFGSGIVKGFTDSIKHHGG